MVSVLGGALICSGELVLTGKSDMSTGSTSERAHPLGLPKERGESGSQRCSISCLSGNRLICISFTSIGVLNLKVQALGV